MTHCSVLFVAQACDRVKIVCMCVILTTNFLELATTLKYLGAKWLLEKKVNFTPWKVKVKVKVKHHYSKSTACHQYCFTLHEQG